MRVLQGVSHHAAAAAAIAEATSGWDGAPELVLAFVSTAQDAEAVASELAARFAGALIVGCTTTGEHLNGAHHRGSVVLTAVIDSGIRWSVASLQGLSTRTEDDVSAAAEALFAGVGTNTTSEDFDSAEHFCLAFVDGLRGREEAVTALLADALEGVQLVGGSAGDDLKFQETKVICGDRAFTDGIVVVMGRAKDRFAILKHHHFTGSPRRLAITSVHVQARRVYEMDGLPAITAYASALGLELAQVTGEVTFMNPLTFRCRGETYVRSIQKVHEDGSITFFCAMEEGMVLEIGGHEDMVAALATDLDAATATKGPFDLMIGCNCILRALEADKSAVEAELGDAWIAASNASIGFDTYGEQVDGLHMNQSLVALGLRGNP